MRFFIRAILLTFLIFCFAGCSRPYNKQSEWRKENGKIKVLTTIDMINDLVKEIGKDQVDTITLIQGELDPHSYEMVKGDDEKFAKAELIFYNGLGLEHSLSLRQNLEKNPKAIAVAESLLKEEPSSVLRVNGECDPHIWMDISLWMKTIDPIEKTLCNHDPDHAFLYHERADSLRVAMKKADEEIYSYLHTIPSHKRYLVTSHDAFQYFARRYLAEPDEKEWRDRCEAPEGLAPEAEISVVDLIKVIDHLQRFKISVLFPESNVNRDSLNKIVSAGREKGFTIRLSNETLYGDSMGEASSYLEMILHNAKVIATELNR